MDASIYQRLHPHTYLQRFLERGVRTDGRNLDDWRSVGINNGSITTAEGSALVKWGETTIVCGVKAEIAEPGLDRPLNGWIVPNVDLPPLCSPKFKPGPPSDDSQIISDRLFEVLSTVIDTESLCIEPGVAAWVLYVDATCINHDGAIFDTTLLAMISALQDTRLPKATYNPDTKKTLCSRDKSLYSSLALLSRPVSLTYGTFENSLLSDPSSFEEPLLSSFITVIANEKGGVMSVVQEGLAAVDGGTGPKDADVDMDGDETSASSRTIEKCIEGAVRRRQELLKVLKI